MDGDGAGAGPRVPRRGDGSDDCGLSREEVLATALALIDADGVEALSMRRIGKALDRDPMRLYRHASSKDELLDGVVDLVLVRAAGSRRAEAATGRRRCGAPRTHSVRSPSPTRTSCRCW